MARIAKRSSMLGNSAAAAGSNRNNKQRQQSGALARWRARAAKRALYHGALA